MEKKRGSILISIMVALVVAFIFGVSFSSYSTSISRQANRMAEIRVGELAAHGLAALAYEKIQNDWLGSSPTDKAALKDALASSEPSYSCSIDLENDENLAETAVKLISPLKETYGIDKCDITLTVNKEDFNDGSGSGKDPFQTGKNIIREKEGFIRINIVMKNSKHKEYEDDFNYAFPIKINSLWMPFLSKFTLFVDDAEASDKWRFNAVTSKPDGTTVTASGKSKSFMLLNNGCVLTPSEASKHSSYFEKPVGLVYLGGTNPMILNLARSEEFTLFPDFYEYKPFDGFNAWIDYPPMPQPKTGEVGIAQQDIGISDETAAGVAPDWETFIENTPDGVTDGSRDVPMLKTSVFRLYGTKDEPSPTLVFGRVFRGLVSVRAFKAEPADIMGQGCGSGFFKYVTNDKWPSLISLDAADAAAAGLSSIATAARSVLGLGDESWKVYTRDFASQGTQQVYNAGLAFYATEQKNAEPYTSMDDWFKKCLVMNRNVDDNIIFPEEMTALPEGCSLAGQTAFPGLSAALSDLGIASLSYMTISSGSSSINTLLAEHGLYDPASKTAALNGWVRLSGSSEYTIDKAMTLTGHGGLLVESGNVTITADIESGANHVSAPENSPANSLIIAALNGNITVGAKVQKLHSSLVAGGMVLFEEGCKASIHGSMITGKYNVDQNTKAEPKLFYNQKQALEAGLDNPLNLLGFKLNITPVYIK